MAGVNKGKITQIIGAVLDIKFSEGKLPEINEAIVIPTKNGGKLTVEVAQHLGDDTVRCIAMGPTEGLVRGMEADATGAPISVPVGENTLGRIFNVLGDPIDNNEIEIEYEFYTGFIEIKEALGISFNIAILIVFFVSCRAWVVSAGTIQKNIAWAKF